MTGRSLASYVEAHGITVEIEEGPDWVRESNDDDGRPWEHHAYILKLINEDEGTEMTVPWKQGVGITDDPDEKPEMILDCLISDAWGAEAASGFEWWCGDYGYDPDSRKAEAMYQECRKLADELIDFLGGRPELEKLAMKFERL